MIIQLHVIFSSTRDAHLWQHCAVFPDDNVFVGLEKNLVRDLDQVARELALVEVVEYTCNLLVTAKDADKMIKLQYGKVGCMVEHIVLFGTTSCRRSGEDHRSRQ